MNEIIFLISGNKKYQAFIAYLEETALEALSYRARESVDVWSALNKISRIPIAAEAYDTVGGKK